MSGGHSIESVDKVKRHRMFRFSSFRSSKRLYFSRRPYVSSVLRVSETDQNVVSI
jgi:hypothetical protein